MKIQASTRQWLLLMVTVGFVLRLAWAIAGGLNNPPRPGSDSYEYDNYAWNLAQGRGYRGVSPNVKGPDGKDAEHLTAYRPPGTSLVWAGIYLVCGHRYDVIRVVHCLLGALTILMIYAISKRCFDQTVALWAAAVWTVWPLCLIFQTDLISEPLATFWLLWFVLAGIQFVAQPTAGRALAAGLLLGAAVITRAGSVFLVPLVALGLFAQFRRQPSTLARSALILMAVLAVFTPWIVRNYHVFGRFIPVSTMGGSVLLQANNDCVITNPICYGYAVWDTRINDTITRQLVAPNDEFERDQVAGRIARQWLASHPEHWWYLVQAKFRRAWTPVLQQDSRKMKLLFFLLWTPVLALFTLGFFPSLLALWRARSGGWLIHAGILHYTFSSLVFNPLVRYRFVVDGLCIILACATAAWLWRRGRGRPAPWGGGARTAGEPGAITAANVPPARF